MYITFPSMVFPSPLSPSSPFTGGLSVRRGPCLPACSQPECLSVSQSLFLDVGMQLCFLSLLLLPLKLPKHRRHLVA